MGSEQDIVTAYNNAVPKAQEQNLPGKDASMEPLAEHTKIEKWTRDGEQVKFVINGKAAEHARLRISARLLALASGPRRSAEGSK